MDNPKLDPESSLSTTEKLIHAIKANDVDNVKLLLNNDCVANKSDANMFDISLHHTIEAGNLEIIELLLSAGASLLTISSGKTVLYKVLKNQQFDVVDLMLSKYNAANIDPNNKHEFVHFVIACIMNNSKLVEEFIKKGIDVNSVLDDCADEWAGQTPLYLSVKYLSMEVVETLLKRQADFTFQDKNGNSPLHLAYYFWKSKNTDTDKNEKASKIMDLILAAHTKNVNNFVNNVGLSHFHIACMGRNATLVYYFLQSGVDVNSPVFLNPQNSAAKVPLHLAIEHCRTNIVRILLKHNADINARDSNGLTSLQIVLQKKLYEITKFLLEFKAIVSTEDKESCDAIFQVFLDYPKTGKIIDKMFLACQENLVNSVNEDGLSLLHVACTRNNINVINKLLLTTADVNACVHENSSEWAGYTALHFAASVQNLNAVHVLLEHKANVNVTEGRGLTPLWLSLEAQPNYIKMKAVIRDGFGNDIEPTDDERIMESLLEKISIYNEYDNESEIIENEKLTKVIESLLQGFENIKVVELLVQSQSDVNHKNNFGEPLLFAAYKPFVKCFVNVKTFRIDDLQNLQQRFFQQSTVKIMDCLIKHGIDVNTFDSKNNHILHIIAHSASYRQCVCLAVKIAEMVLKNDANVNVSDNTGSTPLHLAVRCMCLELMECLLKFGANVDAADEKQLTPLHNAVTYLQYHEIYSTKKIFDCLFGSDYNVNARDASGQTPLHVAAENRNENCIVALLENGADINVKDSKNQSPFDVLRLDCDHRGYGEIFDQHLLDVAFDALMWHALKLLVIGHPVDPSYLPHCKPTLDGGKFNFYYRHTWAREAEDDVFQIYDDDMFIAVEERDDSGFYERYIFICEEEDNDSNVPRKYTEKLRDEVKKLKDVKIDDYNSLFDILGKNLQKMTIHVKNEVFREQVCSENLCTRFPNYGCMLKLKFKDGSARDAILEKANESLKYVTRANLPYICVNNIFSYISNRDMKHLITAAQ